MIPSPEEFLPASSPLSPPSQPSSRMNHNLCIPSSGKPAMNPHAWDRGPGLPLSRYFPHSLAYQLPIYPFVFSSTL